jgi:hypothetical protein
MLAELGAERKARPLRSKAIGRLTTFGALSSPGRAGSGRTRSTAASCSVAASSAMSLPGCGTPTCPSPSTSSARPLKHAAAICAAARPCGDPAASWRSGSVAQSGCPSTSATRPQPVVAGRGQTGRSAVRTARARSPRRRCRGGSDRAVGQIGIEAALDPVHRQSNSEVDQAALPVLSRMRSAASAPMAQNMPVVAVGSMRRRGRRILGRPVTFTVPP